MSGKTIAIREEPRRAGDPARLIAGSEKIQRELGWTREEIDKVVTHQVGSAHKRLMFERLELDPARDFPTVERFGNIGSVSLPLSFAQGLESGFIRPGENVALLGIGSGLGCLMLGLRA